MKRFPRNQQEEVEEEEEEEIRGQSSQCNLHISGLPRRQSPTAFDFIFTDFPFNAVQQQQQQRLATECGALMQTHVIGSDDNKVQYGDG